MGVVGFHALVMRLLPHPIAPYAIALHPIAWVRARRALDVHSLPVEQFSCTAVRLMGMSP